jgi:hypothetical protein
VCRGMPPCPWDVCGGGPGGGLVGFLWGMPGGLAADSGLAAARRIAGAYDATVVAR